MKIYILFWRKCDIIMNVEIRPHPNPLLGKERE